MFLSFLISGLVFLARFWVMLMVVFSPVVGVPAVVIRIPAVIIGVRWKSELSASIPNASFYDKYAKSQSTQGKNLFFHVFLLQIEYKSLRQHSSNRTAALEIETDQHPDGMVHDGPPGVVVVVVGEVVVVVVGRAVVVVVAGTVVMVVGGIVVVVAQRKINLRGLRFPPFGL